MTPAEIKAIRLRLDLTQADFAWLLGYRGSHTTMQVSRWERGETRPSPQVARLIEMVGLHGIPAHWWPDGWR